MDFDAHMKSYDSVRLTSLTQRALTQDSISVIFLQNNHRISRLWNVLRVRNNHERQCVHLIRSFALPVQIRHNTGEKPVSNHHHHITFRQHIISDDIRIIDFEIYFQIFRCQAG